jgi:hypothetical protein
MLEKGNFLQLFIETNIPKTGVYFHLLIGSGQPLIFFQANGRILAIKLANSPRLKGQKNGRTKTRLCYPKSTPTFKPQENRGHKNLPFLRKRTGNPVTYF